MEKNLNKQEKSVAKKAAKKQVKKKLEKRGLGKGSVMHRMALTQSAYVRTLLDPVNNPGTKIPDSITTPSFCFQALTKYSVVGTTGTGGNSGIGIYRTLGATNVTPSYGYAVLNPGTTANVYVSTGLTSQWATQAVQVIQASRLVSAVATVSISGSFNNVAGRIYAGFIPPLDSLNLQAANGAFTANFSLTALLQRVNLVDIPASKGYAELRYIPIDPIALTYEQAGSLAIGTTRAPGTQNYATYGAFVVLVDGMTAGQLYAVEFNIYENYEALPINSLVSLVQPTPSMQDPFEMAAASNLISSVPTLPVLQSPAATAVGSPLGAGEGFSPAKNIGGLQAIKQSDEPSFMDKILGTMSGATKVLEAGAPLASVLMGMI